MDWALHDAKNRLTALVEAAIAQGPQTITRRGRPVVAVLAIAQLERLQAGATTPNFIEHLLSLPLAEGFERSGLEPRPIDLDH